MWSDDILKQVNSNAVVGPASPILCITRSIIIHEIDIFSSNRRYEEFNEEYQKKPHLTTFYARATPNIAARTTTKAFAFVPVAALVLVAAGALDEVLLLEVPVAPDAGAVAVGTPKPAMLPVRGPGIVEADAPSPTRKPTD